MKKIYKSLIPLFVTSAAIVPALVITACEPSGDTAVHAVYFGDNGNDKEYCLRNDDVDFNKMPKPTDGSAVTFSLTKSTPGPKQYQLAIEPVQST
jgi:hypothetical protein